MDAGATVGDALGDLLRYEEILGAIAVSVEGLVMGAAGVAGEDVDLAAALGASLVGVAERTTRRVGAGAAMGMSIVTGEGMMHLRNGGDFALILFTERCDPQMLSAACDVVMERYAEVLSPA
jgi:predicted regulator of Ras-like GTPase activity (Roadblock/LC7/MglB family)